MVWLIVFFFFNDTATTEIYTLSLHDALPIWSRLIRSRRLFASSRARSMRVSFSSITASAESRVSICPSRSSLASRSEEHTSELQSRQYLVCRLLLEKKKKHYELHIVEQSHNH